jgi:hypothetical protein
MPHDLVMDGWCWAFGFELILTVLQTMKFKVFSLPIRVRGSACWGNVDGEVEDGKCRRGETDLLLLPSLARCHAASLDFGRVCRHQSDTIKEH